VRTHSSLLSYLSSRRVAPAFPFPCIHLSPHIRLEQLLFPSFIHTPRLPISDPYILSTISISTLDFERDNRLTSIPPAGGYDAIFLLIIDHPAVIQKVDELWSAWEEMSVCPLLARQSDGGLRLEEMGSVLGLRGALDRV